ncbi:helix-turn-helix domain-containing protein [Paenibacillus piscarius]|uniref:helix-turn-helix domain-containing protein n=1 Tax=Paenibacillus piscarius TaxID=1089681 RepID=UPI001EE99DE2|nr:helix-turn-helix domain-containing protein [Paenibacillus piscarius]
MMENLMNLIKKAKQKDRAAIATIIDKFTPKIQKSLYQTNAQNRNDLRQEVNLKMIEAINKYDLESVPGFWEFVNQNMYGSYKETN